MRISDWSSDVCSSDLLHRHGKGRQTVAINMALPFAGKVGGEDALDAAPQPRNPARRQRVAHHRRRDPRRDRKSVVSGKSVSVRVDLGGRRIIKKKSKQCNTTKQDITNKTTKTT